MSSIEIGIRSIQHYLYCPHRWGLIEIDKAWVENTFVTKANLLHERVHNPDKSYTSRGKKVYTSIPIYNDLDEYNLYGIVDCLEITKDKYGVPIRESEEKYQICIVEYKPTKPKEGDYNEDDLMQVFAQKICVDYVFGCDCKAVIYYADAKKRIQMSFDEDFEKNNCTLKKLLGEMRDKLEKGIIPPIKKGQKCSGCSMKDLCMPSLKQIKKVRALVNTISQTEM